MADAGNSWSDGEKASLLLQILDQFKPERGGVDWDKIHLEGRTKKACQNTWHKYTQSLKQSSGTTGKSTGSTPVKGGGAKRKASQMEDGEQGGEETKSAPKKGGRAKKVKSEDVDVDGNGDEPQTLKKQRGRPKGGSKKAAGGGQTENGSAPQTPFKSEPDVQAEPAVKQEDMELSDPALDDDDDYVPPDNIS